MPSIGLFPRHSSLSRTSPDQLALVVSPALMRSYTGLGLHGGQGHTTVHVTGQGVVNRLDGNSIWNRECVYEQLPVHRQASLQRRPSPSLAETPLV